MKNIIIYKILVKHKTMVPILLITAIGMAIAHHGVNNKLINILSWSFILSGILFVSHHKNLIIWQQKSLIRRLKEGGLVLFFSYLALLTPFSILVGLVLFSVQLYLLSAITESGEEVTPLVKNNMSKNKLSDYEREHFVIKQKLNYPEPDFEMEFAIIQNELKIQEVLQLKDELEANISKKIKELNRMNEELEKSRDYKFTESLKDNIRQVEIEKTKLLAKRTLLMKTKQQLEEQLRIHQIMLEHQQLRTKELENERRELKENLTIKENQINEERRKKQYLETEQERIKELLGERYKEIVNINEEKAQLSSEIHGLQRKIENLSLTQHEELKEKQQRLIEVKLIMKAKEGQEQVYKQQIEEMVRGNQELEQKFKLNKRKLENLSTKIEEYKTKLELRLVELQKKERELAASQVEIVNLNKEKEKLKQDNDDYVSLLNDNDEQLKDIEFKKEEILEKEKIITSLNKELNRLKEEKKKQNEHYEELKMNYSKINRPKETKFQKQLVDYRMKELYPNLTFDDHFFNRIKSVDPLEQIEIEKILLKLNYFPKDVKYRNESVLVPKGSAILEIRYNIQDQKGAGKGRLYIRGSHVFAISRTPKEQAITIKRLQSGQYESMKWA